MSEPTRQNYPLSPRCSDKSEEKGWTQTDHRQTNPGVLLLFLHIRWVQFNVTLYLYSQACNCSTCGSACIGGVTGLGRGLHSVNVFPSMHMLHIFQMFIPENCSCTDLHNLPESLISSSDATFTLISWLSKLFLAVGLPSLVFSGPGGSEAAAAPAGPS